jgi:flagellar biosynthesis chaperone FliJ
MQFMVQQYESQIAALKEQMVHKEAELAQLNAQFEQVDQQLGSVSQVAEGYQRMQAANQEMQ